LFFTTGNVPSSVKFDLPPLSPPETVSAFLQDPDNAVITATKRAAATTFFISFIIFSPYYQNIISL
jgi:hypothetical protein